MYNADSSKRTKRCTKEVEILKEVTLKELRLKNKMTQEQVAKKVGVTKDYISMMERAKRNPSDKMKEKLAKIYSTTTMQIFLSVQRTKCCTKEGG